MNTDDPYTTLILRHKKLIWHLCRRYARRDADRCCDLVQEVSVALWEYYGRRKPGSGLVAERRWVALNTNTLLRNMHRAGRATETPVDNWQESAIADDCDHARDLVQDLMAALPDDDRKLLQLRLDGYSGSEIGEQMGLSRDAVYQRINRIIKKLKQISHE